MIQSLEATEIAEINTSATKAERFWRRIPVLGWGIANILWAERTRPIVEKIERQLKSRPEPDSSLWGVDAAKVTLAHSVCRIVADEMSWPNARFVPDDPADVLLWAHQDGLDVEAAIMELEHYLGIKLEEAEVEAWFSRTWGEVIEFLWIRQQALHPQANVWPPAPGSVP